MNMGSSSMKPTTRRPNSGRVSIFSAKRERASGGAGRDQGAAEQPAAAAAPRAGLGGALALGGLRGEQRSKLELQAVRGLVRGDERRQVHRTARAGAAPESSQRHGP